MIIAWYNIVSQKITHNTAIQRHQVFGHQTIYEWLQKSKCQSFVSTLSHGKIQFMFIVPSFT